MSDPDKAADARFDEWEELCEAATHAPWEANLYGEVTAVNVPGGGGHDEGRLVAESVVREDRAFMETFDPDTVLALVQALRAIHDAHYEQQTGPDEFRCAECGHHYPCPTKTQLVYPAIGVSDE